MKNTQTTSVLLVEDSKVNQKLMLHLLANLGISADIASNGQEALDLLETKAYDIILMDLQMPVLDGLETTKLIRRKQLSHQRSWIVALTANTKTSDQALCLAAGMDDYLTKPPRLEELKKVLSMRF